MSKTGQYLGRYQIQGTLGKSARATVFRGFDGKRPVALKCVHLEHVHRPALERLRKAAPTLARLRHPALVSFLELIETPTMVAAVSELALGDALTSTRIKQGVAFDFKSTWDIARQVLDALTVAHARGIFHGNLKAANIFIDNEDRVCVADFCGGLVEADPSQLAPEQLSGDAPNARSDLYQVGVLVYQLVAGRLPFTGKREEVAHRVVQERPVDPSTFSPKIAWQLDWVIQRALAKDPADRFGSARELLDGLRLGLQDSHGTPLPVPVLRPATEVEAPPPPAQAAAATLAARLAAPAATPAATRPAAPAAAEAKPAAIVPEPNRPAPASPMKLELAPVAVASQAAPAHAAPKAAPEIAKPAAPKAAVPEPTKPAPAKATTLELAPAAPKATTAVPAKPAAPKEMTLELAPAVPKATTPDPAKPAAPKEMTLEPAKPAAPKATTPEPVKAAPQTKPAPAPTQATASREQLLQKAKAVAAAREAAASVQPQPEAGPAVEKLGVLFVDDDERILNALRALFRNDYDVHTAESGAKALEVLKSRDIAILVSDQRMPGMTGVELLREARKQWPRTVRLLLTGYSDLAAMVGSINDGEVFRFVKKPWDNDEIREILAEATALAIKARTAIAPRRGNVREASLLVIDPGQGLAKGLERLLAGSAKVHLVASPREGAKLLQHTDVAAVIADLAAGKDDLVSLFRLLKAKRPETLSILVAADPDSDVVAALINHGQIYRFMAKPVSGRELRSYVSEALRRYAATRTKPAQKPAGPAHGVGAQPPRLATGAA